jgi:hypothetical protein
MIAYEWEGPRTFVRQAVVRGSAAGASYAGVPLHLMAGRNNRGQAIALCGMLFPQREVLTRKQGDLAVCPKCIAKEAR